MVKIKVMLEKGAKMPTKAHETDAGYDVYTPCNIYVPARGDAIIDTGVHMVIPKGYVGMIKSKSGLNTKFDLTCEGVIDAGYTGTILVKIYNNGDTPYKFNAWEKLTQIVVLPVPETELEEVEELPFTERGANGFGSSGK